MKFLKSLIIAYGVICLLMWGFQRSLIYQPSREILRPDQYGLKGFEEISLESGEARISGWLRKSGKNLPTIVHFHGNGGNMASRAEFYRSLAEAGFGVLAIDYRGYGKSEGKPSEQGLYQDARAALDYASSKLSLPAEAVIVYGESLGTGVATQMASERRIAGLVLQSPYTSLADAASLQYPWLPVKALISDRFESLSKITSIHAPLLIFHGERDGIVPVTQGRTLFDRAPQPKSAVFYPETGHMDFNTASLIAEMKKFWRCW